MELACIKAMLERTASQPSSPAHFIWSRTELLGRCDIAVVYVSAGTGVGTRSSRDPSVKMVGLVGSHTHLTHLALKLRKRRMWMKQTNIKITTPSLAVFVIA